MKITVHTLVRDEDIWIWYALQSVLPFADKIFVCVNGSSDRTLEIVKSLNSNKIILDSRPAVDRKTLVSIRQEMIDKTKTDWFLILDGDEVWPKKQLTKLITLAEKADKQTIGFITNTRNCLGDVYHYMAESAGHYKIGGYEGNLTIRLIRKTKDMHMGGIYPWETWSTKEGPIQKLDNQLVFSNTWYLHTSYLQRSSIVQEKTSGSLGKRKFWEKGLKMEARDLPEVLYEKPPSLLKDPLEKRGKKYEVMATITTPLLTIRRKIKHA